jgi:hypothetical protein
MIFETEQRKREIGRWCKLAIQLNGAADSGRYDHITIPVMVGELQADRVFAFLERELAPSVWQISKLTDGDRHKLSRHWQGCAAGFEPAQFHVERNGLALLVSYILHLLDVIHVTPPT